VSRKSARAEPKQYPLLGADWKKESERMGPMFSTRPVVLIVEDEQLV